MDRTRRLRFTKMHGQGNDFVVLDGVRRAGADAQVLQSMYPTVDEAVASFEPGGRRIDP